MNACTRLLLPLVLAFPALPALADDDRAINVETYRSAVLAASGHPNELSRWHGMWTFDNGRADEAIGHFQRAASYGDKLSQHFLTLMYWNGEGVDRDPVLAYVWADLAAERGDNDMLIRMREKIWSELTPQQREQAVETGQSYFDRYGDQVAIKRANAQLRRFMRTQTGSRVGLLTSRLEVNAGRPDLWASGARSTYGPYASTGTEFYSDARTRPAAYWQDQDLSVQALLKRLGTGRVDVGDVDKVDK